MAPIDYSAILMQAFEEYAGLLQERQNLDLELAKKRQFIKATLNMLSDEQRECFNSIFEDIGGELGLTDAIRKALQTEPKKSFTASDVRDKLKQSGFDFSSYKANPLASIHAVLKRLKPDEVEATEIDGVAAWRWVGEPAPDYAEVTRKFIAGFNKDFDSSGLFESGAITSLNNVLALRAFGSEGRKKKE
jgi:hypothetical protein